MIVELNPDNLKQSAELALKLWPDASIPELITDFKNLISHADWKILLYKTNEKQFVAFIQSSLRNDYVEGCLHKPVLYIEGIYVEPEFRQTGIATQLIEVCKTWGTQNRCKEIASDAELDNQLSIDFHKAIGFEEVNRVVAFKQFIKASN